MRQLYGLSLAILLLITAGSSAAHADDSRKESAERFVRGVFACDPAAIDELAAEDVMLSYPIFEELFGTPVIKGRDAVREFAEGFCARWEEPELVIHEAIAEGDRVVLVWSFLARRADPENPASGQVHAWGGISVFHFDAEGRITAEFGEESTPGPAARTGLATPDR